MIQKIHNDKIILYRDRRHKKAGLCEYLAQRIATDKTICLYSNGAFGLYMAKAFPTNKVFICGRKISEEYKSQIEKLTNATMIEGLYTNENVQAYAAEKGYFFVDQFGEQLIKEYYKNHFEEILQELGDTHIDAFCDCGHSCATMSGFIESGLVDWKFVLGVNTKDERKNLHFLSGMTDKFLQEKTFNFDTNALQKEMETAYPKLENVFEATRSISAAISWLGKNQEKTVLVYVGDSPVFGADATI